MATSGIINSITSSADILTNIANNLGPVQNLLRGASFLIGLSFAFKAIYTLKVYGEARTMMATNSSLKEPLVYMMVAAIFLYFPTAVEIVMNTTFGYSTPLAYAPVNSTNSGIDALFGSSSTVGWALSIILKTIGLAAFIRGWVLIARSASQGQPPGGTGKGLMHVIGGIMLMNIVGTLTIIDNTLYG